MAGSAAGDMEVFQSHAFFDGICWKDVLARKVVPLFRPHAAETYIDPEAMHIPVGHSADSRC